MFDQLDALALDALGREVLDRVSDVQSRRSETRSVTTRFTSSGISQSRERRPDSRVRDGRRRFVAASATHRRVDVAPRPARIRVGEQVGLDARHHAGLLRVGAGAARGWRPAPAAQSRSMSARRRLVVVLTGVQADRDVLGSLQGADDQAGRRRKFGRAPRPRAPQVCPGEQPGAEAAETAPIVWIA